MNQLVILAKNCEKTPTVSMKQTKVAKKQKSQADKPYAKDASQEKEKEFPKLTWLDFRARPKQDSHFYAHSYWIVSYSYSVVIRGNQAKVNMNAKCVFEKDRSWAKPELKSKELLEHEQGHYYIGCLCALNLKKKINSTTFTKVNYKNELQRIYRENMDEFLAMEKRYDEETHHFLDQEVQKKWDKLLNKNINELKKYWWI